MATNATSQSKLTRDELKKRRAESAKRNLKPFQFQPGGPSGNPNGRPKKKLLDEVLEDLLLETDSKRAKAIAKRALDAVEAQSTDKFNDKLLQLIIERTQGKPKQAIELSGPAGGAIPLTISFLDAIIGIEEE